MKKSSSKKTWMNCNFGKIIKVLFLILLVLFIAAQIVVDRHLLDRAMQVEDSGIKQLIIEGLRSVRKEAVVDGPSGRVYLPDARIVLPAYPRDLQGILYSYDSSGGAIGEDELLITSKNALGQGIARINTGHTIEEIFGAVPKAQSCSRQIVATSKPVDALVPPDYRLVHSMQLADGRNLYMYLDTKCEEHFEPLLEYLKQLQSY